MKCHTCNQEMKSHKETYHYIESGLDNVFLDGVSIYTCSCGEEVARIPSVIDLNSRIGNSLLRKQGTFTGKEIRFLRKNIGLNTKDFAEIIGMDKATVSRWENGKQRISKPNDLLIRLVYAHMKGISREEVTGFLSQTPREDTTTIRIAMGS